MTDSLHPLLAGFHAGTADHAFEYLGCHPQQRDGVDGFVFRVWAPGAQSIHVTGDFNFWNTEDLPMEKISRGVWEVWTSLPAAGSAYKYMIRHWDGKTVYKADPMGFRSCRAPDTSSVVCDLTGYKWHDSLWFAQSARRNPLNAPMNIYELHLGSWRRKEDGSFYSYSELAPILAEYVKSMGYTHVEFLPLAEYPYDPSWGYQPTHFYSPTSRYGTPQELMALVDTLHQAGIGVILDWVGTHFPADECGLHEFDGTCAYEVPGGSDASSRMFDFSKPEVRSFLISNAVYWLEQFHFDGLRVDIPNSVLYLDENSTNRYGGRENLDAIYFLRQLNRACFGLRKGIIMSATESSVYPGVTKPGFDGGLGFLFKWNTGWTSDTLNYMGEDPIYRKTVHNKLTFPMTYAFAENFVLPLSHDEVVPHKGSLMSKMPGEYFWKFANLRLLRGYQIACPGKKLSFMGSEFGQFIEWNSNQELDWMLFDFDTHRALHAYTRDLNRFYLKSDQLWSHELGWDGYQWIQPDDQDNSILAFRRIDKKKRELLVICNFTPVLREDFRLGVPKAGTYVPVFCSDEEKYGGTGEKPVTTESAPIPFREYADSAVFRIPPMSVTFYSRTPGRPKNQ
jgi:1,4-alpha-glucan branching enzyme